jgi:transposase-like protein
MKKQEENEFDHISKLLAEELRNGKKLTGKDGALTPLLKQVLESALEGELDEHIQETKPDSGNRRNGHTQKNLKTSFGDIEIFPPRDRDGSFNPQTVAKRQRVLPGDLDEKILALYSRGLSYSDIRSQVEEIYGIRVSDGTISAITDRVIPVIREWQSRPLETIYPIIWMDAMHFKVRNEGSVKSKAIYTILGVTLEGKKEVLGLYQGESESASFWLQVLSDLSQRGIKDILIASIDNLKGFAEAIESIFPKSEVQLCVIHQIRNSLKYIPWKNQREFMRDLKAVYKASTKETAEHNLDKLEAKWGKQYPIVFRSWRSNWERLSNYFKYPEPIRRLIYTTNTVEGYHRMVRKITKSKGAFTSDTAVLKLIYLATMNFHKKWQNSIYDWPTILNQLTIIFEDRIFRDDTFK